MPDRSLRLLTLPQQSVQGGERSGVLLREQPASPPDAPSSDKKDGQGGAAGEDNPFAPPPEGTPDRPWQPRRPEGSDDGSGEGDGRGEGGGRTPWGGQWSDRQPGRSDGGFGQRPGAAPGGGPDGPGSAGPNLRWDPTDPSQRRARYALLCGMWAFFFVLFGWPYVSLMLGALAMYWGISALRAKPRTPDPDTPAPPQSARPQTTAAISGLVTASLAIVFVAANFTARLVYDDYYTCTNDALTNQAQQACADLLPKELRGVLSTNG
ncbi:hypothetical protein M2164_003466 [Streptomyces sp. SAI-208]|jgi:hypothetical protein|uniref:hypothetical protein n=1 Tax=unclassified Streptomyces TaxID=2593676 RepID=UPI0024737DFE|nr:MULTISPECIES: hypothetical protein [unclassified Streptomyces]MDH6517010.1 hypothetical protein [Streptomyces sp. SAI-090]MDH6549227.1 hypothetical protein [Streptomyces sp. SAI-041]MDH6568292.1 hypothetical protein [Streptomyces sp. SAI-117]MDH6586759.1 hypothetical protein [Streptomyces sp. SAI-133]MDH6607831.1 hypothetical protein [Streptomyces sp. SAI-208]